MYTRLIEAFLADPEFADCMIFISGPRQVGKTTLAQKWLHQKEPSGLYYNWDDERVRRLFRIDPVFFESQARKTGLGTRIVFDEIHKIPQWKNLLKGYYDSFKNDFHFMITGSARLDLFRRSGDSLLGRYHLIHLSPLTPLEAIHKTLPSRFLFDVSQYIKNVATSKEEAQVVETLLRFSGFPGIYTKQSSRSLNLWHREYKQRMIREDLRDLTKISDLSRVEHLMDLLPTRVGAPLSLNALKEEMLISHQSIRNLMMALEKLDIVFMIRPYHKKISYSLKKEPKFYFYDWTLPAHEGSQFENFMAVQLKIYTDIINDFGFGTMELHYLRDKQKREIDFLLVKNQQPWMLIEVKNSFSPQDKTPLNHFHNLLKPHLSIIVVKKGDFYRQIENNQWILSPERFLKLLWEIH